MTKTETSNTPQRPRLIDELRAGRREFFKAFGPGLIVTVIGFAIAFYFVEPPPPHELTMATGPADGNYYAAAHQYARLFARNGITLNVLETAGTVENYQLLLEDDSVHVAIVQGGTAPRDADLSQLESLASLYLEPMWVFHRRELTLTRLSDLQGKRIAVGEEGSGTQLLAESMLEADGVVEGEKATVFLPKSGHVALELLDSGEADAAFFVLSADADLVREMLLDDKIRLFSFERNRGYSRRYPFLRSVTLEQGVVDLERNLPSQPVKLIAPVANLVAVADLHDAFIPLLLEAATETHQAGGLLTPAGEFPSLNGTEFPVNKVAQHYIQHGPSFFEEYLGFWVASLIDRAKIMLVPFIILLIPLAKLAPPVYRWRIRSRIYRWYGILRKIDQTLREGDVERLAEHAGKLTEMERELEEVNVPLSYMEEFYNLRLHIDLVKRRLTDQRDEISSSSSDG